MIIIIIPTKFEYEYKKKTVKFYFRFYWSSIFVINKANNIELNK